MVRFHTGAPKIICDRPYRSKHYWAWYENDPDVHALATGRTKTEAIRQLKILYPLVDNHDDSRVAIEARLERLVMKQNSGVTDD